ncbi:MAG TPA: hydantoinase/oxoprolinase family protein [Streptosporangiaceae bacterium]|nr:hydantoinase/oxoprolinase family protein [Streptosporangiaceae bacterium]
MPALDYRLGIDVGGTNTDAVILDRADQVLAKAKVPTTPDVTGGIVSALDAVLRSSSIEVSRITHAMLGTTHATNAVLERRKLHRVAVIRIGAPATLGVRPMFEWPADLTAVVAAGATVVAGGIEFDGRDLSPFDDDAVAAFLGSVAGRCDGVAITSVFAPVSPRHELLAAEIVKRELGEVPVSLSHEIGSVGLLERENATILNAALAGVAGDVARALGQALAAHELSPVTFFAQNDGTLMALDHALRYPVLTIGSGPANSIRGAAFLTGRSDALVADVGGTSTDVGVLVNGFPRESSQGVEIGGIRTNFRMPDLVTIALGGGTIVTDGGGGERAVRLGPESVGYRLQTEALVFGGSTPTLTDSAVATGRAMLGDRSLTRPELGLLEAAARASDTELADAIDRVKTAKGDQTLIAVGGGSILIPDELPGVSEVIRPDHYDAANAIGAAIASVSGQVDRIFHFGPGGRKAALDEASQEARDHAVAAGADPGTVQIVELEEIPLAYLTSPAVRIRAKAAGALGGLFDHQIQASQH